MRRRTGEQARKRCFGTAVLFVVTCFGSKLEGQVVTTFAGSGAQGSADGIGTAASFNGPYGIGVDGNGNLYVGDWNNNKVRKITPSGVVTTFAGSGAQGSTDGTATAASFYNPGGAAVDANGNVYVADVNNHKIRKLTPGGVVTTFAGSGAQGCADGTGTAASFFSPVRTAVDGSGSVYVGDADCNKVRKITSSTVVTTLAGSGVPGSADGTGSAASFNFPGGVAVDGNGNVFVSDWNNNKIRRITSAGVVTTIAGSGFPGSTDGAGNAASFNGPGGLAVDKSGNVYVADRHNNKIRKITPAGVVTTLAGSGVPGSADGTATTASFNDPSGVAVDGDGTVYVSEMGNNKIRKITQSSCQQDAFTACLIGGRYKVTSHWQNQYAGGQVSTLSATRLTDATAAFWLSDANTYEYLIRINTATDNGRAWIAIPTFTDVEFWIEVTDTLSQQYYEYHSAAGNRTLIYDPYYFIFP